MLTTFSLISYSTCPHPFFFVVIAWGEIKKLKSWHNIFPNLVLLEEKIVKPQENILKNLFCLEFLSIFFPITYTVLGHCFSPVYLFFHLSSQHLLLWRIYYCLLVWLVGFHHFMRVVQPVEKDKTMKRFVLAQKLLNTLVQFGWWCSTMFLYLSNKIFPKSHYTFLYTFLYTVF